MRIDNNINITNSFKSRNSTIRLADDIVRKVNKEYPGFSPSNYLDFHNLDKCPRLYPYNYSNRWDSVLYKRIMSFREIVESAEKKCKTAYGRIQVLPSCVKKHKIRNCGESAKLACVAAKVNNITDFYIGLLRSTHKCYDIDHNVVVVENGGKPYIMDAWLGFADYVPNAMERYKYEFGYRFNIYGYSEEKLYTNTDSDKKQFLEDLDEVPVKKLRKKFPNLVVEKPTSNKV